MLGLGCAALEPPFVDREPELLRRWSGKIGVIRHPRRCRGCAKQDACIVKARERTHQPKTREKNLVRRATEPGLQQRALQFRRTRQAVEHDRHIDQRIVAVGRLPVDQPQALAIEQDVVRDRIVVAGDQFRRACVIGFAEPFKAFDMRVQQAGRKNTGSAHMRKQAGDDIGIVDEGWKDRRGLNARKQHSQRLRQRPRPRAARIGLKRLLFDEVDHRDAGRFIEVVNPRGNPRLRRDAHGEILVRIAQRTWLSLHPQQIAPAAGLDPEYRRAGGSAGNGRDRADGNGADDRGKRRARGLALRVRQRAEMVLNHDYSIHRATDGGDQPPTSMFRSTKQAPPARRMRLQRSSAAGRVSAPIRT